MNYEALCAQQALNIAKLELQVTRMSEAMRKINLIIYGIGGPLNDNNLAYTNEQLQPFWRIAKLADESN